MSWFIFGMLAGYAIPLSGFGLNSPLRYSNIPIDDFQGELPQFSIWIRIFLLLYGGPMIGGLVVVAQMINSYGNCVKLE